MGRNVLRREGLKTPQFSSIRRVVRRRIEPALEDAQRLDRPIMRRAKAAAGRTRRTDHRLPLRSIAALPELSALLIRRSHVELIFERR